MNLINQLFFAVLISSVTNTVLLIMWWVLRSFFMITNPKMVYTTLRWICVMYLMPIGYIAVLFHYRQWVQGQERILGTVFARTAEITDYLRVFSFLWFIIVCFIFLIRWKDHRCWCRKLQDNIPEEDPVVMEVFQRVCGRLQIKADDMVINKNVLVGTPLIVGLRHPQILLPEYDYTAEDLELIFYHELSHHKNRDLGWKGFVVVVMMVHCFNPLIYLLLGMVNFWSECMADVSALEASGNLHNAKPYFDNIVNLIPEVKKQEKDRFFFSALCNNKTMISRRVDFMKKYLKAKHTGGAFTAAITAAFVFASTTTAFASGEAVADLHNMIYQNTEVQTDETSDADKIGTSVVTEDGMVEYYCRVEDLDAEGMEIVSTPEKDMVTYAEKVLYNFNWTVNPNTRHVSGDYTIKAGRRLSASVTVSPTDKDFKLGIMTNDGVARFVRGQGSASHNFDITEEKSYRVFVQNDYKDGTILKAGGYFVYEAK